MIKYITSFVLAVWLSGCAMHLQDKSFLRPVEAGEIALNAAALPAGYALSTDKLPTPDGQHLYRARFTHPQARSTVLFFGGNTSTLGRFGVETATELTRDWHPNVVLVDYRGYGQSSGQPTLEALRNDALLVYDQEAARAKANGHKMVIAGFSLGGVVAGGMLQARQPDAAILIATVTNVPDMVEASFPWYMKPFFRVTIDPPLLAVDNLRMVQGYKGPLLVVGGEKDSQTPVALSRRLFEASASPTGAKRLAIAPGADHNDVLGTPEAQTALKQFAADHAL